MFLASACQHVTDQASSNLATPIGFVLGALIALSGVALTAWNTRRVAKEDRVWHARAKAYPDAIAAIRAGEGWRDEFRGGPYPYETRSAEVSKMISAIDEYRNLLYAFGTKDSRAALHEYRTSLTDLIAGGSDDGIDVVRPKAERAMKAADDLIKRLLDDLGTLEK